MGYRSVYCSSSGFVFNGSSKLMAKGSAVAWIHGTTPDTGDGTGFGYAVDYPIATNSMVCGVLWDPDSDVTTFRHQSIQLAITKGIVSSMNCYGAAAVGALCVGYSSTGWASHFSALFVDPVMNWGCFAKAMETEAGTTHTIVAYVNTML
jgi:hypothetical protein